MTATKIPAAEQLVAMDWIIAKLQVGLPSLVVDGTIAKDEAERILAGIQSARSTVVFVDKYGPQIKNALVRQVA
jgi:hypothetical protein